MLNVISDEQLWLNIKCEGSLADFNELYNRYWEKLYTNAFYYLKDQDLSANVVQDIFVTIWRRRKFLTIECMRTYLGCAVKYAVFRELKKTKRKRSIPFENITTLSNGAINNVDAQITYRYLEAEVEKELDKLPKRCKEIFLLSRWDQLTSNEIADYLNISKRTVDNQITLALKHLRLNVKDIITLTVVITNALFWR